jgi:predicted permease
MVAAGLFVRTLANLQSIPTGFNQQNVTLFTIDTATTGYKSEQFPPLLQEVEERTESVPGVQAAAFSFLIFSQGGWNSPIFTRDETPMKGDATVVRQNTVGPNYFTAMGIPVVAGRVFNRQDTAGSQAVAVVSETMARRFYPNSNAVGRRFGTDDKDKNKLEIIGVVKDVKYYSLTENPRPLVYYPHAQDPGPLQNFAVRFSGRPETVVPQIRQMIRSVNPNLPVDEVVTLADHIDRSLTQQKLVARLASFFGLLALLLACIGLYGVLSYSVSQRKAEIGVRMALGATTADVLKLILKGGMTLVLLGVVLGIAGAFAVTRLAKALLFGVKPSDPLTFVAVAALLIVVAIIACYIPARRATKVDPLTALRYE